MTEFKLNEPDKAKTALARGKDLLASQHLDLRSGDIGVDWNDWIIAQVLAAEARGLIDGKPIRLAEVLRPTAAAPETHSNSVPSRTSD
jgi:hypothetical protein